MVRAFMSDQERRAEIEAFVPPGMMTKGAEAEARMILRETEPEKDGAHYGVRFLRATHTKHARRDCPHALPCGEAQALADALRAFVNEDAPAFLEIGREPGDWRAEVKGGE